MDDSQKKHCVDQIAKFTLMILGAIPADRHPKIMHAQRGFNVGRLAVIDKKVTSEVPYTFDVTGNDQSLEELGYALGIMTELKQKDDRKVWQRFEETIKTVGRI